MDLTYIKIDTSSKHAKSLIKYLKSLEFVKVLDDPETELSLLQQIELGLREVKLMQDGKLPQKEFSDFLTELELDAIKNEAEGIKSKNPI